MTTRQTVDLTSFADEVFQEAEPVPGMAVGLIGCGSIAGSQLRAYRARGIEVLALCDRDIHAAEQRRREFYPQASIHRDHRELLDRQDLVIIDIATHADVRPVLIRDALLAGKHVMSQKPFVMDLNEGRKLVALAQDCGRRLAVHQNQRWLPSWRLLRAAVQQGMIGCLQSVHLSKHWDHDYIKDHPQLNRLRHLILYDYAIHAFDFLCSLPACASPRHVQALCTRSPRQEAHSPLLARVIIGYDQAQASLTFDGHDRYNRLAEDYLLGTAGSLRTVSDKNGCRLHWYRPDGDEDLIIDSMVGRTAMAEPMLELMQAIAENRQPDTYAGDNLTGLALTFAATVSADLGQMITVGSVDTHIAEE